LEVVSNKATKALFAPEIGIGARMAQAGLENGVIFRAFPNGTIGLAPSLNYSVSEVDELVARVKATLDQVAEQAEVRAVLG
jgi:adenosylmethionine-8-amino-7-oxononanoate aminotransferase